MGFSLKKDCFIKKSNTFAGVLYFGKDRTLSGSYPGPKVHGDKQILTYLRLKIIF